MRMRTMIDMLRMVRPRRKVLWDGGRTLVRVRRPDHQRGLRITIVDIRKQDLERAR